MSAQIYAIGNALVDHEFPVDDALLNRCQLTKGTMQLANAVDQQQLIGLLSKHTTPTGQMGGGSAANTAYTAAALGASAFYACSVGQDPLGDFYLNDLQAAGVQVAPRARSLGTTGTCLVLVTPEGERTMQTHLGVSSELSTEHMDLTPLTDETQYIYIEGYLATSDSARHAVKVLRQAARKKNIKIALSLSDPAMVQYAQTGLLEMIDDGVDLLFCNEMEARLFTNADTLDAALIALKQYAPLVVVTRGEHGAVISHATGLVQPLPPQVATQVLDTNGAGDAFAGAFLYGLTQKMPLTQCGFLAVSVATAIVAQFGPRLNPVQYKHILATVLQTT